MFKILPNCGKLHGASQITLHKNMNKCGFLGKRRQIILKYCHSTGSYPRSSFFLPLTYSLGNVIHSQGLNYYLCARYFKLLALYQILSLSSKAPQSTTYCLSHRNIKLCKPKVNIITSVKPIKV